MDNAFADAHIESREAVENPWAIIVAGGCGRRMAEACGGAPKQFISYRGAPLYWRSALAMSACGTVAGIVFVFPPEFVERERERLSGLNAGNALGLPFMATAGGRLRQDSVFSGLTRLMEHCPACASVLVHDAARPFVSPALIRRVCAALGAKGGKRADLAPAGGAEERSRGCGADAAERGGQAPAARYGIIPALAVTDTVKELRGGAVKSTDELHCGLESGKTLDRRKMVTVQTPQGFHLRALYQAHLACREKGLEYGDDASMLEEAGLRVGIVPGEPENVKITAPQDLRLLERARRDECMLPCAGFGYDVHRYAQDGGRPMKLGGVLIANAPRVLAHSDGDVLLHALADAVLGCCGGGDIGVLFPDSDPQFSGLNSARIVDEALRLAAGAGVDIVQADLTVVAQIPKIAPWRAQIRRNVARILQIDENLVNVKATTEEGLGFTGAREGVKATALVSGLRRAQRRGVLTADVC